MPTSATTCEKFVHWESKLRIRVKVHECKGNARPDSVWWWCSDSVWWWCSMVQGLLTALDWSVLFDWCMFHTHSILASVSAFQARGCCTGVAVRKFVCMFAGVCCTPVAGDKRGLCLGTSSARSKQRAVLAASSRSSLVSLHPFLVSLHLSALRLLSLCTSLRFDCCLTHTRRHLYSSLTHTKRDLHERGGPVEYPSNIQSSCPRTYTPTDDITSTTTTATRTLTQSEDDCKGWGSEIGRAHV